jgi:hypothetical protein
MQTSRLFIFFSSVLLSYFIVDIGKILLAKRLNKKLTPLRVVFAKKITAIVIVVFGISLLVKGIFPGYFDSFDTSPFEDYFLVD